MFRAISGPASRSALPAGPRPAVGSAARQQPNRRPRRSTSRRVGPKVGEALPEFSLRDQGGHIESLKSLLGPKGAVIVFFRSADW